MTYKAGTRGLSKLGIPDDDPRIECDGCGLVWRLPTDRPPPVWFLDGKAPKGWGLTRTADARDDRCPRCREKMTTLHMIGGKP